MLKKCLVGCWALMLATLLSGCWSSYCVRVELDPDGSVGTTKKAYSIQHFRYRPAVVDDSVPDEEFGSVTVSMLNALKGTSPSLFVQNGVPVDVTVRRTQVEMRRTGLLGSLNGFASIFSLGTIPMFVLFDSKYEILVRNNAEVHSCGLKIVNEGYDSAGIVPSCLLCTCDAVPGAKYCCIGKGTLLDRDRQTEELMAKAIGDGIKRILVEQEKRMNAAGRSPVEDGRRPKTKPSSSPSSVSVEIDSIPL